MTVEGPILLLGGRGMLGRAWAELLGAQRLAFDAPGRDRIDLARPDTLTPGALGGARLVVNCAAWTDVDGAETHEPEATVVNGDAVGVLAEACRAAGATLIHYSTDYVFNGRASSPYPVDAPIDPVNAYGRSKAVGERLLGESGCDHLLLRTSWLYAPWGQNFVRTITKHAQVRDRLRVVDDQHGRPTSCEHLAAASLALWRAGTRGVLHVTDGGQCTWYAFATRIAAAANPNCTVEPCTSAEFPRPAPRPAYSVLDLGPTEAVLGPMPPWQELLDGVLGRLEPVPA